MEDLDVNLLIETYNNRLSKLLADLIVKETVIKQLERKAHALTAALKPHQVENVLNPKNSEDDL